MIWLVVVSLELHATTCSGSWNTEAERDVEKVITSSQRSKKTREDESIVRTEGVGESLVKEGGRLLEARLLW